MTGFLPSATKQIVENLNILITWRDLRDCITPLLIRNDAHVADIHESWHAQDIDNHRKLFELYDDMLRKI